MNDKGATDNYLPVQLLFCLKEKNKKKVILQIINIINDIINKLNIINNIYSYYLFKIIILNNNIRLIVIVGSLMLLEEFLNQMFVY